MTDIAKIGLAAETADLTAAIKKLDQLSVAAAKAEVAAKKLSKQQASASLDASKSANTIASASYKAATAANGFTKAQRDTLHTTAMQASASVKAATAADQLASANYKAAKSNLQQAETAQEAVISMLRLAEAGDMAAASALANATQHSAAAAQIVAAHSRTAASAGLTSGQMQSNFTNMAAQFQDIGVTAAMGMNPLMIGLQQGAQISGIFAGQAGGLANMFRTVGTALLAVLSPVSLFIIALVAGIAALVQWVDWIGVAKSALNGLANIMPELVFGIAAVGGALALAFAPQIIVAIWGIVNAILVGLVPAITGATAALWTLAAANPFAAIIIGIGLVIAAAFVFRDELTKIFGFDIIKVVKDSAEFIIDLFKTAYQSVLAVWGNIAPAMDDLMAQAVQNVRKRTEEMINSAIKGINSLLTMLPDWMKVGSGQIATVKFDNVPNPNAGAANRAGNMIGGIWQKNRATDDLGNIGKALGDAADWAAGKLRGFTNGLGGGKDDKAKKSRADSAAKGEKTEAEKFAEILRDGENQLYALQQEGVAIGMVGQAAKEYAAQTDLINKARAAGIKLTVGQTEALEALGIKLGEQAQRNEESKYYDDNMKAMGEQIDMLKAEAATIGMSAQATAAYMFQQKLLNDEKYRGIVMSEPHKAKLIAENNAIIALTESIRLQREALDFAKDSARGFMGDMFDGLKQGKSLWETFGNAVLNVLDRIINKMLDMAVDAAFSGGSGGGGFLKMLGNMFGGGLGGDVANLHKSNAAVFAKGGTFTNGIVNSPTAFYAKGGTPGVMGEAGPEAIIPLKRGPDGSLGVQMHRGSGKGSGAAPAINVSNNYQIEGAISSPDLVAAIRQSGEMTQQQVKRQLQGWLQTIQRDGTIV